MLKLWGRINSINVQKVRWALAELAVPCERIEAGMEHGVVGESYYKSMNPNSRVPTIDDEGFVLWESNAIVRYLSAKHGAGTLWPADLRVRADADRWMDWTTSTLQPLVTPVFWALIRTPPEKRNAAEIEALVEKTNAAFAILEHALAGRDFIAGPSLTMGDIPLGTFVHRWLKLPVQRAAIPNIEGYFARLEARAAYRENVMIPLS
jgi:glutathione S-transferase